MWANQYFSTTTPESRFSIAGVRYCAAIMLGCLVNVFRSLQELIFENLSLRQQLLALHAQRPRRRFTTPLRLFWVLLRKAWAGRKQPLILVTPKTVVGWHRAGFRMYWKGISRVPLKGRRKPVSKEARALIFRMVAENPTWGAPQIHGKLFMLGLTYPKQRFHDG